MALSKYWKKMLPKEDEVSKVEMQTLESDGVLINTDKEKTKYSNLKDVYFCNSQQKKPDLLKE